MYVYSRGFAAIDLADARVFGYAFTRGRLEGDPALLAEAGRRLSAMLDAVFPSPVALRLDSDLTVPRERFAALAAEVMTKRE